MASNCFSFLYLKLLRPRTMNNPGISLPFWLQVFLLLCTVSFGCQADESTALIQKQSQTQSQTQTQAQAQAQAQSKSPAKVESLQAQSDESNESGEPEAPESYWEGEVGLILGLSRQPMGSFDSNENGNVLIGGLFSGGYYNGNFFIETNLAQGKVLTLGYTAYESDDLQLNLIAEPLFLGFDGDNQKRGDLLTGLDERDTSWDAGFELMSSFDFGQLGVRYLHDVSATHKGDALSLTYAYPLFYDKMTIWPSMGLSLINKKTTNYYFGVQVHEARLDRPLYQAGTGVVLKWGVYGEYELTDTWTLLGFARYNLLKGGIGDSPLTTRNNGMVIAAGITWRF